MGVVAGGLKVLRPEGGDVAGVREERVKNGAGAAGYPPFRGSSKKNLRPKMLLTNA